MSGPSPIPIEAMPDQIPIALPRSSRGNTLVSTDRVAGMNSAPPTPITPRTAWDALRFRVEVRGQRIEVDMRPAATTYRLLEGSGLMIEHFGEPVRLRPGVPVLMPCLAPHEVEETLEPDVAA